MKTSYLLTVVCMTGGLEKGCAKTIFLFEPAPMEGTLECHEAFSADHAALGSSALRSECPSPCRC